MRPRRQNVASNGVWLRGERDAETSLKIPGHLVHEGLDARQTARRINERLADIVAKNPSRFGALATLPCRSIDDTLEELTYALDTLKFDGLATPTSIDDAYLGQPRFDPWFEEMHRRGVTLFVHPVMAEASRPLALGLNQSLLEFMFDTTRMITNMVLSGAKERFSNIKVVATHGGEPFPIW